MYVAARRRVSNLLSFVSAGTQGKVVFNLQNALLSTLIRARSLALAAFLGARLSKSSLLYFPSDANSSSSASSVGVEARRLRGIFCNQLFNPTILPILSRMWSIILLDPVHLQRRPRVILTVPFPRTSLLSRKIIIMDSFDVIFTVKIHIVKCPGNFFDFRPSILTEDSSKKRHRRRLPFK